MPTESDAAILKLAEAVMSSVAESKAVRQDLIQTMHAIDKNVAVLTANSEAEKGHRLTLEVQVNGLREEIADVVKDNAAKNVKTGLMWSTMTGAIMAGLMFAWHTITGKGG